MRRFKILGCTIRDGGYYNNWDFEKPLINSYIEATNDLPIDYIEISYRNNPQKEYLGKYAYGPVYELEDIRSKSTKKISVMLNEKDVKLSDLDALIEPIKRFIDMVRIAVDPVNIDRAVMLAAEIKRRDRAGESVEIGFNLMYMSRWDTYEDLFDKFPCLNGITDVLYIVDSFGSATPREVAQTIKKVKEKTSCKIGFHGHNNLELALINTLSAIENGADFVDSTILGMGRGAGNLKTELLLVCLNKYYQLSVNLNKLEKAVYIFSELLTKYDWGTNLPYMISGINSFPQKDVMEWISDRSFSLNAIVRALDNKERNINDNAKYPILSIEAFDTAIIVGGGLTPKIHREGIKEFIRCRKSVALIHSTSRHAADYQDLSITQFLCLTGNEGDILKHAFFDKRLSGICVLPPHPRKMGTEVPDFLESKTFELRSIDFTANHREICTEIALQIAALLTDKIYIIGYDGYPDSTRSKREVELAKENSAIFTDFISYYNRKLISLTPTHYAELDIISLYQLI